MEDGEEAALKLWENFRNLSIEKYKEVYGRLNVYFDVYSGESQYSLKQVESVVNEMREANLLKVNDGAEIVDLNDHGLGAAVIVKKDGSLLYLSRDIAAAIDRFKTYKFERMFYVVGSQQDHHFKQLFKILELMGKSWSDKCTHINFGMIKGMSTRRGNVVFLEDMLDQTRDEMHNVMKSNAEKYAKLTDPDAVADLVGISSIMIQDMSARRHKDYAFDWSRMLSFEGDTGPYLQYAHSRLCSIERTFEEYFGANFDINRADISLLTEPQAIAIMDVLCQYPDLVKDVETSLEPCSVVGFCFDLTHRVSAAIEVLWVRGREREVAEARMALYVAARITLGNALRLLGLKPLERM
jgi:arginyl-tRNA synthetase